MEQMREICLDAEIFSQRHLCKLTLLSSRNCFRKVSLICIWKNAIYTKQLKLKQKQSHDFWNCPVFHIPNLLHWQTGYISETKFLTLIDVYHVRQPRKVFSFSPTFFGTVNFSIFVFLLYWSYWICSLTWVF